MFAMFAVFAYSTEDDIELAAIGNRLCTCMWVAAMHARKTNSTTKDKVNCVAGPK